MKYTLIAVLKNIVEADLIDIKKAKERKEREKKDRIKRNEQIKRDMELRDKYIRNDDEVVDEEDDEFEEGDYFDKEGYNPEKVWKSKNPKGMIDLGEVVFIGVSDWTEFHDILSDFYEEVEGEDDYTVVEEIMEKYIKENPKWNLEQALKDVYEEGGVDTIEERVVQFYQLPSSQFGEADVGPSSNILEPDEYDLEESIERSIQDMEKSWVVIYSDDKFKYKKMINELRKEQEKQYDAV